jgi:hypothetical protein
MRGFLRGEWRRIEDARGRRVNDIIQNITQQGIKQLIKHVFNLPKGILADL